MSNQQYFMKEAIALSKKSMEEDEGGPFGCIIVKDGQIIARGNNKVTSSNDPTAHAEVVAIREACRKLNNFQLQGCEVYTSCEPCPMCLGAIYWARPDKVYFANTRQEAAQIGFDDAFIYEEINIHPESRKIKMIHLPDDSAQEVFNRWLQKSDKIRY
jgi:tRNA(Arg) A34 adenosine deaminase TadA